MPVTPGLQDLCTSLLKLPLLFIKLGLPSFTELLVLLLNGYLVQCKTSSQQCVNCWHGHMPQAMSLSALIKMKHGTHPFLLEAVMAAFELLIVVEEPEVDSLELRPALTSGQQLQTSMWFQYVLGGPLTLSKLLVSFLFSFCSCFSATTAFSRSCNKHKQRQQQRGHAHQVLLILTLLPETPIYDLTVHLVLCCQCQFAFF